MRIYLLLSIFAVNFLGGCAASLNEVKKLNDGLNYEEQNMSIRLKKDGGDLVLLTEWRNELPFAVCMDRFYFGSHDDLVDIWVDKAVKRLEYTGPISGISSSWPIDSFLLVPPSTRMVSVLRVNELYAIPEEFHDMEVNFTIYASKCNELDFDNLSEDNVGSLIAAQKKHRVVLTTGRVRVDANVIN